MFSETNTRNRTYTYTKINYLAFKEIKMKQRLNIMNIKNHLILPAKSENELHTTHLLNKGDTAQL